MKFNIQILTYVNRFFMMIFSITLLVSFFNLIGDFDAYSFLVALFLGIFQILTSLFILIYVFLTKNQVLKSIKGYVVLVVIYLCSFLLFIGEIYQSDILGYLFSIVAIMLSIYFTYLLEKINLQI